MDDIILDASLLDIIDNDDADVYGPDEGWGENEDAEQLLQPDNKIGG